VSQHEVEHQYIRNNTTADVSFVRFPYADVKSSKITVTESDLKNYYNKHKDKFHQEKSYDFKYVSFDKTPTKQDTARTISRLKELRPKFAKASEDSVFLAQHQSTSKYNPQFIAKKDVEKLFRSTLSKLDKGEVSSVLQDNGTVYILKKEDEKGGQVKFSVLSHGIEADPVATIDKLSDKAKDFRYYAKKEGFKQEAERRNLAIHNGSATKGNIFIAGLGQSRQILNMLKDAEKGAISESIELPNEFVILKVTDITPEGPRPFSEVKKQVKEMVLTQKRQQQINKRVSKLLENNDNLKALAKESGKKVQTVKSLVMSDKTIPGAGREPKVIGVISDLKKGVLSHPVDGVNAVYVVQVTKRKEADPKNMSDKTAKEIRKHLQSQKNDLFAGIWLNRLKAKANIVDNRSKLRRF
jgi:peptidyl-prolyl cis-trans isomerase D